MKTPNEILNERGLIHEEYMSTTERVNQFVTSDEIESAMLEYAKLYHESEVKKLTIPDVMQRSELLIAFVVEASIMHCDDDLLIIKEKAENLLKAIYSA